MLQTIREKSQGWIATIILGFVCFTFALWGIHYYLNQSEGSDVIAKVNGTKITEQIFNTVLHGVQQQAQVQLGGNYSADASIQNQLKQQALSQIINNEVLSQALHKDGFYIGQEQIIAVLARIPAFQENGAFSNARFQQVLAQMSLTEQQFMQQLQDQLMASQLQNGLVASGFALPNDIINAIHLMKQTRDVGYIVIDTKNMKDTPAITEAAMQAYYQAHQAAFTIPAKVSLDYVLLSMQALKHEEAITDQQAMAFYQENQRQFITPATWQISRVAVSSNDKTADLNQLSQAFKNGDDVRQAATDIGADILSALWVTQANITPAEYKVLQSLKVGEVSKPLQVDNKVELIKVINFKPETKQAYEAVAKEVKAMLANQTAEKQFANSSEDLANLAYENPSSLQTVAKQLKLMVQTTPLFAKGEKGEGILQYPQVAAAAFASDVYQNAYNSEPITLSPTEQVVVRVNQKEPARVLPFEQVEAKIKDMMLAQAKQQAAENLANKAAADLAKGLAGQDVAKTYGLVWQEKLRVDRHQQNVDSKVLYDVFQMQKPSDKMHPTTQVIALPSGNYAAVALYAVNPGDVASVDQIEKHSFDQVIGSKYGDVSYQLYVEAIHKKAKIKTYVDFNQSDTQEEQNQ